MNRRALLKAAIVLPVAAVVAPLVPLRGECGGARTTVTMAPMTPEQFRVYEQASRAGIMSRTAVLETYGLHPWQDYVFFNRDDFNRDDDVIVGGGAT